MAAERSVNAVLASITEALAEGDSVKLVGFGVFETVERAERVARKPRINEEMRLPPTRTPVFRPSGVLKSIVSSGAEGGDKDI